MLLVPMPGRCYRRELTAKIPIPPSASTLEIAARMPIREKSNVAKFRFMCLLFQILIIPHQHLLNLADIHRMEVTLGIILVDGFLIEKSTFLQFRLI